MRKLVLLTGLMVLMPLAMMAQDEIPQAEIYTGYSYLRLNKVDFNGWNVSIAGNINRHLAFVGDVSGLYNSETRDVTGIQTDSKSSVYSILAGPRISDTKGRWTPFVHLLGGWSRLNTESTSVTPTSTFSTDLSQNGFGLAAGAGIDFNLNSGVTIRIVQADYLLLRSSGQKNEGARVSVGLVFRIGQKNP